MDPESLSCPGPPDLRRMEKCSAYNEGGSGCDRTIPGGIHAMSYAGSPPVVHACSYLMVDGLQCGRRHSHLNHWFAIKELRATRLLGGDVLVTALR